MGWRSYAFATFVGLVFGGPLGALFAAVVVHQIGRRFGAGRREAAGRPRMSAQRRSMIFCASAAAMLAKMAKADGRVTPEEIASVETAFARLGFSSDARTYAIGVFRRAKDDGHTIYEYAADFAAAMDSIEVRELFYELLWDLACADGCVSGNEMSILRRIPSYLRIRPEWFELFRRERIAGAGRTAQRTRRDELADAYATLGVSPSANDAEVKKAYRDLAKRHHPDVLRARGLPEEMIGKASEKMGRINEAWRVVRERRSI